MGSFLSSLVHWVCSLTLLAWYLAGWVLAKGWWCLLALFPPYPFYLVVKQVMQSLGCS